MSSNDKSNGPRFLPEKELSLEELLEITAAGPSYDEAKARRALMRNAAAAERFRDEARRILLQPHDNWVAERHDGLMEFIACTSKYLEEMRVGREVIDKLAVYYVALGDLDDGVEHPMLKVKVKDGNPSIRSQIWRLRGMCAVALEYLAAGKEPSADAAEKPVVSAAKKVARIPGIEKLLSGRAKSSDAQKSAQQSDAYTSILKWRKTARSGKKMDETLRTVWAHKETFASIGDPQLREQEFRKEAARLIEKIQRELKDFNPPT